MLVERVTLPVKHGCWRELLALLQTQPDPRPPHGVRIYRPRMATFDVVAMESEFESLTELDDYWNKVTASPGFSGFVRRLDELTEPGGTDEVWTLVEPD